MHPHEQEDTMDTAPILICYDGSEEARHAIAVSARILGPRRAVVLEVGPVLTTAETYLVMGSAATGAEFERLNESEALGSATAGAERANAAGFDATPRSTLSDSIREGVLDVADEIDAAAIVVAPRGLTGLEELVDGSVTHDVAQHAHRPVLVVPPAHDDDTAGEGPVLICYDGSVEAHRAIHAAADLLGPRRAVVLDVGPPVTAEQSLGAFLPVSPAAAFRDANADDARRRAEEGASQARAAGFDAEARGVVDAPTWEGIADVARELDAALIVLGSQGRNELAQLVEGSVVRQVAEHADRPTLIVPPDA
jgi:nucleotide-binding universal stress UspA family protein